MSRPEASPCAVPLVSGDERRRSPCPEIGLLGRFGGFTLLELMLSLTLLGIVLLIIFGALRIGTRAWEKGEQDVSIQQRQRAVLNLMENQIASATPYEVKQEDVSFYFKGSEETMAFVSRIAIVPGSRSGVVFVRYRLLEAKNGGGTRLMLFEKDVGFLKAEDVRSEDERDFVELVSNVEKISFSYLKEGTQQREMAWQSTWSPPDDEGMPVAVKVVFQQDEEADPVELFVPIRSRNE